MFFFLKCILKEVLFDHTVCEYEIGLSGSNGASVVLCFFLLDSATVPACFTHRLDFLTTIHYSHNPVVYVRDCLSAILPLPLATPPPTLPPITAPPKGVGMSLSLTQKVFYGLEFFIFLFIRQCNEHYLSFE